jgi:succinate-semialdehyde dehydrogenase/glutarate-semialdehyde dehydrogenase
MESSTQMGPMANPRRIAAMEAFIGDAVQKGATLKAGGHRIGNKGNFFEPTVLTGVPMDSRIMNEDPFGPVAVISPFKGFDDVVEEANRLPYGLALPEVPFGGVKDSGYGSEGGSEAIEAYLNTKFVSQAGL